MIKDIFIAMPLNCSIFVIQKEQLKCQAAGGLSKAANKKSTSGDAVIEI